MGLGERIRNWFFVRMYEGLAEGHVIIKLDAIDHNKKTPHEAVGIDEKAFDICRDYIYAKYNPVTLAEKLGIKEKIAEELGELLNPWSKMSEIITSLWKKRNKKQITLEEYVGTYLLIDFIKQLSLDPVLIRISMIPKEQKDLRYIV